MDNPNYMDSDETSKTETQPSRDFSEANNNQQSSSEVDIEKVHGDSFWDILEESSSNTLQVQGPLREILKLTGFDNVRSLESFSDADFSKVEQFMRTKLHKILEKKFSQSSEEAKQKELEKFYGPLFCFLPEEFEILGGHRRSIEQAAKVAGNLLNEANKKKTQVATIFKQCFVPSKLSSTKKPNPSSSSVSDDDYILNQTKILSNNIQHWFDTQAPELLPVNEEGNDDVLPIIVPVVARDPFGKLVAEVLCVVCSRKFRFGRDGQRWSTSNFYRHIQDVHLKKKRKQSDPRQNTLSKMFKRTTDESEGSVDSPTKTADSTEGTKSTDDSEKTADEIEDDTDEGRKDFA